MDYKINTMNTEVQTEEILLPEINGLRFGILGARKAVFDYAAYFKENGLEEIDYKVFMRLNKHFISSIANSFGIKASELFYQDKTGKILVAAELSFLFVAFANPAMLMYFNGLLTDVISDGVAYSNGYIYSLASNKLPSNTLNEIIKERTEEYETTGSAE